MALTVKEFLEEWNSPEPYVIAHTSGSTGKPKEIRLLKEDMWLSARATNRFFGIGSQSLLALPLSPDYIAGKMMIVRACEVGCQLMELPVSNVIDLDMLPRAVDLLPVVPSQVDALVARCDFPDKVRNLLVGGSALSPERASAIAATGVKAYLGYGMTETCSHVALSEISGDGKPAVYRAMPGISFSVDNRACLVVEAPHFSFRRLVTNDVVELLDSRTFHWKGRFDNVINSGGIKLFPEELEKLYAPVLAGRNFYLIGRPDTKWGTALVLVVEGEKEDAGNIIRRLEDIGISGPRLPRRIEFIQEFPRTASGKIRRL